MSAWARMMLAAPSWQALDYPVIEADCFDALHALPACSVDAIVTDPPYGLEFMGKDWDAPWKGGEGRGVVDAEAWNQGESNPYSRARIRSGRGESYGAASAATGRAFQEWCEAWAVEALRVLKPGGHMLVFGGTRTYHRLAAGIEDAGFEIRDTLAWMFGSGFPKSLDVSKAIDKAAGAERKDLGPSRTHHGGGTNHVYAQDAWTKANFADKARLTAPATLEAAQWEEWGTALKPGFEPILVARKPLSGTVPACVLEHGTGALNIGAARIPVEDRAHYERNHSGDRGHAGTRPFDERGATDLRPGGGSAAQGRWPANVVLDEAAAALLDEQSGELVSGANPTRRSSDKFRDVYSGFVGEDECVPARGVDRGGASRFFYCAKAGRRERNAGLDGFERGELLWSSGAANPGSFQSAGTERAAANHHPTVKPAALMRWLLRLVGSMPDAVVLDLFAGSGTTICAGAIVEPDVGRITVVGIERDPGYVAIARARAAWWAEHPEGVELRDRLASEASRRARTQTGQLGLLDGGAAA